MEATKTNKIKYFPPQDEYWTFDSEDEYADKGRGWGLFGKAPKKQFWYKAANVQRLVTIKGYMAYNDLNILVVEFEDGNLTCIHPSYLKEMQSGSFGKEVPTESAEISEDEPAALDSDEASEAPVKKEPAVKSAAPKKPKEPKPPKEVKVKLELPVDKVKFAAKLKEFATKANPFSDTDDEVLLFEEVSILGESPLTLGDAWCGYSNTLKGLGLEVGDVLEFDGKVVDKKFNKEIVYKVNNPSKIVKK